MKEYNNDSDHSEIELMLVEKNDESSLISSDINNIKPIPYRDSKLTLFLKDSLGGNAKTSIIGNISPSDSNNPETISTLNFAICAKKVKNKAIINEELSNINKANYIEFKIYTSFIFKTNNIIIFVKLIFFNQYDTN